MISTTELHKSYFNDTIETKVLRGISFHVDPGQFLAIIGPSGAGKSTLLYQLALLDNPTSGTIIVDKQDVTNFSETEAVIYRLNNFGFVFQEYALVPELTAMENVMVPIIMTGTSNVQAEIIAKKTLESLEMGHVLDHLPSQLSGGEQQRVSIARAIARKPKILFADEPTANLDTKKSQEVLNIFRQLNKEGQTIVMVTHELEYAALADRIIEIRDGVLVKDYKPTA